MSMWEDVKKNLLEWYSVTSDKTSEVARVTSLKYDKFGISRDIERQFSELGNLVYTGLKDGREELLDDPDLRALVARLEGLETELAQKDQEIDEVRARSRQKRAAAATAAADGEPQPKVITDPVLEAGGSDSAILVEPAEAEVLDEDNQDRI